MMDYIEKVQELFKTISANDSNLPDDIIKESIGYGSPENFLLEMNNYSPERNNEYLNYCILITIPGSKNKRYVVFTEHGDDPIMYDGDDSGHKYNMAVTDGHMYVIDENQKDYMVNAWIYHDKRESDKSYNGFIYTSNKDIYYLPMNNNVNRELFYFSVDGMVVKGQIFHPNSQNEKECISAFSKRGYHFKFDPYFPR